MSEISTMDDLPIVHPRTADMHKQMRVRAIQRRQAKSRRRQVLSQQSKTATVVDVNAYGDVKLDRFTNEDGVGEYFTAANGTVPQIGSVVPYTDLEGVPVVLGTVGETGEHRLGNPDDGWVGSDYAYRGSLRYDPRESVIRRALPKVGNPFYIEWDDHFHTGTGASLTGRYDEGGTGPALAYHVGGLHETWVRLQTGGTSGNARWISMREDVAGPFMRMSMPKEAWFVIRLFNTTQQTLRWGFFNDVNSTLSDGFWFEYQNNNLRARHYGFGGDQFLETLGSGLNDITLLYCIAVEPWIDPADPDVDPKWNTRVRYTVYDPSFMQIPAEYVDSLSAAAPFFKKYEAIHDNHGIIVSSNNVMMGARAQTNTNAARMFDIDWWGGWSLVPIV
jgi:hypothetical protein